jgi:hypothetical protein
MKEIYLISCVTFLLFSGCTSKQYVYFVADKANGSLADLQKVRLECFPQSAVKVSSSSGGSSAALEIPSCGLLADCLATKGYSTRRTTNPQVLNQPNIIVLLPEQTIKCWNKL